MFMFCRLAMMKEFLFMSGLEEPSYTHPARAPHTHTPDSLRQARPPRWTRISSSAMMDHRYWWSCSLKRHPHPLWHLLINAQVHVKGFYCSPAAWLWSLLLSFSLFEPYVWPDFPFTHFFFFFVVTGIMMWFIHVGVPMPGASAISPTSLMNKPAPAYVVFRMLVCPPSFFNQQNLLGQPTSPQTPCWSTIWKSLGWIAWLWPAKPALNCCRN